MFRLIAYNKLLIDVLKLSVEDRDSSVGIATSYGRDGHGVNPSGGRVFPQPSRPDLGPTSLLYNGYRVIGWRGVKRARRGADHPPHLAPRLNKEYIYTSTPSLVLRLF